MNLLDQLHDIDGLDSISIWPLAIGWWVCILLGIVLIGILTYFIISKLKFLSSWKRDALQKLDFLEKNLSEETARETVVCLSEYLRRIALKRFSREECAGLFGKAWLKWLVAHDSKSFDWENKGIVLIETPYSPQNKKICLNQIKDLIQAVRDWVC